MKKILHLLHHDTKFVNTIIRLFNSNQNVENSYIIESNVSDNKINSANIYYKTKEEIQSPVCAESFKEIDIIIIHYFTKCKAKFINNLSANPVIIWSVWGGDFYDVHPEISRNLLEKDTALLKSKYSGFKVKYMYPMAGALIPNKTLYFWQKKVIHKINYIAPVIDDEYELIKKYYQAPHLKLLNFSNGNLEDDFINGLPDNFELGENILLGNSSSFSNNHIEIIDVLSELRLPESTKIIAPLSYGDSIIKDYIVGYGKKVLGNNYTPLVEFISREDYHRLLTSCGYVVMNHKRQQGLGMIITMIYMGAKVFFNKDNPTYNYFKRLGASIFLIDDIKLNKTEAFTKLSQEQKINNREIIIKTRSKKVVDGYIQKIAEL